MWHDLTTTSFASRDVVGVCIHKIPDSNCVLENEIPRVSGYGLMTKKASRISNRKQPTAVLFMSHRRDRDGALV